MRSAGCNQLFISRAASRAPLPPTSAIPFFAGERARGVAHLAQRDVEPLVRALLARRGLELAQRLDPGARRLPAPASDHGDDAALRDDEVRRAFAALRRIALAPIALLELRAKRVARESGTRERRGDALRARPLELAATRPRTRSPGTAARRRSRTRAAERCAAPPRARSRPARSATTASAAAPRTASSRASPTSWARVRAGILFARERE